MRYRVTLFTGRAADSGANSGVYVQIECGRKAGPGEFYVGESMHGHAGRYTGYNASSGDKLRVGTPVVVVCIERTDAPMSAPERKIMEGLLVEVCSQRPKLSCRNVTLNSARGSLDFVEPARLAEMEAAAHAAADLIESFFP